VKNSETTQAGALGRPPETDRADVHATLQRLSEVIDAIGDAIGLTEDQFAQELWPESSNTDS